MKRLRLLAIVTFLVIIAIASYLIWNKSTPTNTVRIGAILPLTGTAANYGELMKRGILLATDEINNHLQPGMPHLEVIIEDSRSNSKDGVLAMQKLINVDKVPAVMPALSSVILACIPIAEQKKVVILNCPANSPKLRGAGKFLFNIYMLSDQESQYLASYAYNQMGARSVGVYFVNNDSGIGYRDSFTAKFTELGGTISIAEGHEQGTVDFHTSVEKFRAAKPDLIFLCSYYAESALFLKQCNEVGYKTKWLSYSSIETPEFLKLAGSTANGIVYSQPGLDLNTSDSTIQNFVKDYESHYQQSPDLWSALYYDGTRLLYASIRDGAQNGTQIQTFLKNLKSFPAVTGNISFDKQGCVIHAVRFKTVQEGRFISEQ